MDGMMDAGSGSAVLGVLTVLLVLVLAGGAFAAGWFAARHAPSVHDEPVEMLRRRLAAGEIDDDEYLRRRSAIEGP